MVQFFVDGRRERSGFGWAEGVVFVKDEGADSYCVVFFVWGFFVDGLLQGWAELFGEGSDCWDGEVREELRRGFQEGLDGELEGAEVGVWGVHLGPGGWV